jgi:hypothetical protein
MFAGFSLTLMVDGLIVFKVPPVYSSDLHTGWGFSTELADLVPSPSGAIYVQTSLRHCEWTNLHQANN